MTLVGLALIVPVALVLGLLANRYLRRRFIADDTSGPSAAALVVSIDFLAVFFIAFVLSSAASSFTSARNSSAKEANIVDNMFEATAYVTQPRLKKGMQASLVCYARAVAGPEWTAMAGGSTDTSPVPSNWTGTKPHGLRLKFQRLGITDPAFGTLSANDAARGDARRDRLAAAKGNLPSVVFILMLALVALTMIGYAFVMPRVKNGPQIAVLWIVALALTASLLIIKDLNSPFSGTLRVKPTAIQESGRQDGDDFISAYGKGQLPCDENGNPKGT
jgi:hypothetical protein